MILHLQFSVLLIEPSVISESNTKYRLISNPFADKGITLYYNSIIGNFKFDLFQTLSL